MDEININDNNIDLSQILDFQQEYHLKQKLTKEEKKKQIKLKKIIQESILQPDQQIEQIAQQPEKKNINQK